MARLAILSSVPQIVGGEYWNDDVLLSLYVDVERTLEEQVRAAGGDLLAFALTTGEGSAMERKGLALAYMFKFNQICDHPALYLGTDAYRPEYSGKFLLEFNGF